MKKFFLILAFAFPLLSFTPEEACDCDHSSACLSQALVVQVLQAARPYFGTNLGTLVSGWNHGEVAIVHYEANVFKVFYGGGDGISVEISEDL